MGVMEGQLCQRVQKMVKSGLVVKIIRKKQPMAEEWKKTISLFNEKEL